MAINPLHLYAENVQYTQEDVLGYECQHASLPNGLMVNPTCCS